MTDFITAINEVMQTYNKTQQDIAFIGSDNSKFECTWFELMELAEGLCIGECSYKYEIVGNLIIRFTDMAMIIIVDMYGYGENKELRYIPALRKSTHKVTNIHNSWGNQEVS